MRTSATFPLALVCALSISAACQAGPSIGMGTIPEDAAKTAEQNRRWCEEQISAAKGLIAASRWGEARQALDKMGALATESMVPELKSLYLQIDNEGQRQLKQAKEDYRSGNYAASIKAMARITREYGWLPAGMGAKAALKEAEADPKAQAALYEGKAAALVDLVDDVVFAQRPGTRPAAASRPAGSSATLPASRPAPTTEERIARIKKLSADRQVHVMELLDTIAKTYPSCPSGQLAAAELAALNSDKAFMAALDRHRHAKDAQKAFQRAEAYHKAGMDAKALEYYKEVVAKFPGTPEAAQAKTMIGTLSPAGKP